MEQNKDIYDKMYDFFGRLKKHIIKFFKNLYNFIINAFNKPKDAAFLMFMIMFILIMIVVIITNARGGFFHFNTDDVIQYYPFMTEFISDVKNGTVSLYNSSFFLGASSYASAYYVPIDVFTLLTLIFSFVMKTESAYAFVNLLKPICGALVLYYALYRKGYKVRTSFFAGFILFVGGMTEAYFVFPVYLSLVFYAPLAILVADLFLENKKWSFLIPLYVFIIIFYDFYLAYMLLAFLFMYILIMGHVEDKYSFFGKNTLIKNKNFYINFFLSIGLIIIGLMMSLVVLLPSVKYILNETYRSSGEQELWAFSARHYFTIWTNYFFANDPFCLMIRDAGDYVKEHVSFYMTIFGLIFFVYFFTLKGKSNNRMKFWIILFNILFIFPVFSMIFSGNTVPYVRWFFIVYMFNLIGVVKALDYNDFHIDKKWYVITPIATVLIAGLVTLIYVIAGNTDLFIHYKTDNQYFYPLLILGISIIGINIFFLYLLTKKKYNRLINVLFLIECISAFVIIMTNVKNTYSGYYKNQKEIYNVEKNLLKHTNYEINQGYRVNFDNTAAKAFTNTSSLATNFNFGTFFHSFYDNDVNDLFSQGLRESSTSWSRNYNAYYNIAYAPIFNVKYIVVNIGDVVDISNRYNLVYDDGRYYYYELSDLPAFSVVDTATNCHMTSMINRAEIISNYVWYDDLSNEELLELAADYNLKTITDSSTMRQKLNYNVKTLSKKPIKTDGSYFIYDISDITVKDLITVYALDGDIRKLTYEDMYIRDTNNKVHGMNYQTIATDGTWQPNELYVRFEQKENINQSIDIYVYDDAGYEGYIQEQSNFINRKFELNGDQMIIQFKANEAIETSRVIKTAYSYSADWKVNDPNYQVISINGGMLGILVPPNTTDVDIVLDFVPDGYKLGSLVSFLSITIYLLVTGLGVYFYIKRKKILL